MAEYRYLSSSKSASGSRDEPKGAIRRAMERVGDLAKGTASDLYERSKTPLRAAHNALSPTRIAAWLEDSEVPAGVQDPRAVPVPDAVPRPATPGDMGGDGVRMPASSGALQPSGTQLTGQTIPGLGRGTITPEQAKAMSDSSGSDEASLFDKYPGLVSFSGRLGASAGEREASAFGSGRGRTRVPMGGEIQFNEDDARRPGQLARQAFERSEEDRAMKQRAADLAYQQQLSEAKARMGFEAEHGIPYDPDTARYIAESNKRSAMEEDMKTGSREMFEAFKRGDFDDPSIQDPAARQAAALQVYQKKMIDGAIEWGSRINAPEGYYRSILRQQEADALNLPPQ